MRFWVMSDFRFQGYAPSFYKIGPIVPSFPSDNFCYDMYNQLTLYLVVFVGYHDPQVKFGFGLCQTLGSRVMPLYLVKLRQYHRFRQISFVRYNQLTLGQEKKIRCGYLSGPGQIVYGLFVRTRTNSLYIMFWLFVRTFNVLRNSTEKYDILQK